MLKGLSYNIDRGIGMIGAAYRRRRYNRRTKKFTITGEKGLKFDLYPDETIDRDIEVYGIYERKLLHYLDKRLDRDAIIIDIGANIGNHALFLSDDERVIHCFEPNPSAWLRLERNVEINARSNIHVHRFGLGDADGLAPFQENVTGNLGASGYIGPGQETPLGFVTHELPIRQADQAITELELARIDFIKMDVEGLESALIPALRDTIARHRPIMAFEYSGHVASDKDWSNIVESLPDYRISRPQFGPLEPTGSVFLWNLRHAGAPQLIPVTRPERQWYECLLAEPN